MNQWKEILDVQFTGGILPFKQALGTVAYDAAESFLGSTDHGSMSISEALGGAPGEAAVKLPPYSKGVLIDVWWKYDASDPNGYFYIKDEHIPIGATSGSVDEHINAIGCDINGRMYYYDVNGGWSQVPFLVAQNIYAVDYWMNMKYFLRNNRPVSVTVPSFRNGDIGYSTIDLSNIPTVVSPTAAVGAGRTITLLAASESLIGRARVLYGE